MRQSEELAEGCFKGELGLEAIDPWIAQQDADAGLIGHERGHRKDEQAIWTEHE